MIILQGQKGQNAGEVYPKSKGKPTYKRSHLEREKEFGSEFDNQT